MGIIHQVNIGPEETKYFRFINGNPQQITADEFNNSGLRAQLFLINPAGEQVFGRAYGGSGRLRVSENVIDVLYSGKALKKLGGKGEGALVWPGRYFIGVSLNTLAEAGDLPEGSDSGSSGGGGSGGTFAAGENPVQPPDVASPPGEPPSLPTGNGNAGFQGSGSTGVELGITGGNS